jgi:predicted transcriptional regulator YdeE
VALQKKDGYHFVDCAESWFVGLGSVGPYRTSRAWVMPIWEELIRRQGELPASVDRSVYLSPCHGRESEFTFWIGFACREEIMNPPTGMSCFRLPPHTYAVGEVRRPREEIDRLYDTRGPWADSEGRPTNPSILWLEIYRQPPAADPAGPFDYDIYLPLR